jgi:hypothetical protein
MPEENPVKKVFKNFQKENILLESQERVGRKILKMIKEIAR